MDQSKKFLYLNSHASSSDYSISYPVGSLVAVENTSLTSISVHFMDSSELDTTTVVLTIDSGQAKAVMQAIAESVNFDKSHTITLADDYLGSYIHSAVTAVATPSSSLSPSAHRVPLQKIWSDTSLTAADSGTTLVFQDTACVITLPDSGSGALLGVTYTFIAVGQGGTLEVKCVDDTNEKIIGALVVADTDDITSGGTFTAEAADNFSSVEFTGTTEGEPGSMFKLTCIDTDRWFIEGVILSAGTSATPFATS